MAKTVKELSSALKASKNLILRGAPGNGKTYLAKQIAADIISGGEKDDFDKLDDEQKKQMQLVQFHPSYDYTDFVEGLRPERNKDGSIGFELQDGIFKEFVAHARDNYENSQKTEDEQKKEASVEEAISEFLANIDYEKNNKLHLTNGNEFTIEDYDDEYIYIDAPKTEKKEIKLKRKDIRDMLNSEKEFDKRKDVEDFFRAPPHNRGKSKNSRYQTDSYAIIIYKKINELIKGKRADFDVNVEPVKEKDYVFIIDEINRGEISKIFGELFFSIEPSKRGKEGQVSTQYANLHPDPAEKFYIPENVYIIGTMNDIDRSVDSFDFAMRRRFRFVEITAEASMGMLDSLDKKIKNEARNRMTKLNDKIAETPDLGVNYQIGAAYFLYLKDLDGDFDLLWQDYLQPLLQEYVRGMPREKALMDKFEKAYYDGYEKPAKTGQESEESEQGLKENAQDEAYNR